MTTAHKVFTQDVPPAGFGEMYLSDEEVASVKSAGRYRNDALKAGDAETVQAMEAVAGRILIKAMTRS